MTQVGILCAALELVIRVVGSVLGHEDAILQYLQHHLQPHVKIQADRTTEAAAATLLFCRVKPRLPADELQELLSSVQSKAIQNWYSSWA